MHNLRASINNRTAFLVADYTYYILGHLVLYRHSLFTEHHVFPQVQLIEF